MSLLKADALRIDARAHGRDVAVLHDLCLSLPPGGSLALAGESGAGKTLLTRAIAGHLPRGFAIASGALLLDGEDLCRLPPARLAALAGREIAFLPPDPRAALAAGATIGAQVAWRLRALGIAAGRAEMRSRVRALLEDAEVPEAARAMRCRPDRLPAETLLRALAAMLFAARPKLLVADAPTAALDEPAQARVLDLLGHLRARQGTALLFLTRDLRLAARVCDGVVLLYAGRAMESGPAAALLAHPAHPYTRCLRLALPVAGRALRPLPGAAPRLPDLAGLAGCRFAPRCPVVQPACREEEPPDRVIGQGHRAACLRTDHAPLPAVPVRDGEAGRPKGAPVLLLRDAGFREGPLWARRWAIRGADLTLCGGEILGLIAENAADRAALLRLATGLARPAEGQVLRDGRRPGCPIALLAGDPRAALALQHPTGRLIAARFDQARGLLAEVGLPASVAALPATALSAEDLLRVAIARALAADPRLLVVDDILAPLDPTAQGGILDLLLRLRDARDLAILFAARDLAAVGHVCDRVLVVQGGAVVEEGTTAQVFAAPLHASTRRLLAAMPPDDPGRPRRSLTTDAGAGAGSSPIADPVFFGQWQSASAD